MLVMNEGQTACPEIFSYRHGEARGRDFRLFAVEMAFHRWVNVMVLLLERLPLGAVA